MYVCPVCSEDPSSHSFKKIRDGLFYTKPAEATRYWDRDGICAHYDGVLNEVEGEWSWIFDAEGFTLKHILEVDVAISLAQLITTKYSHNLKKISIINPNWYVKVIMSLIFPFLSEKVINLCTQSAPPSRTSES
jgi:hypothetical protein